MKTLSTSVLSLLLAISVFLNGIHVKDVLNSTWQTDPGQNSKIASDAHPHLDKQVHKISHDSPLLDGRSLRLRDYKRIQTTAIRNWLDSWREQLAMYFS